MGGRTGFGTCSPHPELCGFDYRPRVGQLGCSEQTGEGEKSSSRSPAAHKTHCGGEWQKGMQEMHDASPSLVQLNLSLNSAVCGPPGIVLELLAMLGKNRLLCVELSPLKPAECGRRSPPRPAAADGAFRRGKSTL